jgi:hypothetical protein
MSGFGMYPYGGGYGMPRQMPQYQNWMQPAQSLWSNYAQSSFMPSYVPPYTQGVYGSSGFMTPAMGATTGQWPGQQGQAGGMSQQWGYGGYPQFGPYRY